MLNAMTDEEYMQLALQEARAADVIGEIPIGAVLVVEGEVVARAHNMRETWNDATAHAEVIVIREACKKLGRWRLEGAVLYVTVEPCPMCSGAIVNSRIDKVVYGCPDAKAGGAESIFNIISNDAVIQLSVLHAVITRFNVTGKVFTDKTIEQRP